MRDTDHILEAMRKRRSVRKFTDEKLTAEEVQNLMESALRAPSSRNKHTTQFVLVEDPETLNKLSYMRSHGVSFIARAPLAIVILGSPMECALWKEDATLAAAFLQLEAESLGLGSCWGHVHEKVTENGQDSAEYVRRILDIPYQLEVLCVIAVGHKAEEPEPHTIEQLRWEQLHIERYKVSEEKEQ
ncbi:NAD(P)H nitroreductase [Porphyromonas macacae]|uniref:FMN reductase (NADPH) n=1 Tax=Porphyromonas macacae TaxID=28115 RepID=A0A0A2E3U2_9PORP|nr:nitroreductase family protein [Porphyromonas macacae]KGN72282.1 NAD(P)H nitroreductase [Porphyromonas macacae]SUB88362.1 FMN reductase (NADPH) [Porphyromonas macacae]